MDGREREREKHRETADEIARKEEKSKETPWSSTLLHLPLISTLQKEILAEFGDKAVIYDTYIAAAPLSPNEQEPRART